MSVVEDFYAAVGEKIKFYRTQKKITHQQLGDYLELTRTSVINFEKARHRPSIYQLIQIAGILEVDYTKLIPAYLKDERKKEPSSDKALVTELKNAKVDDDELNRKDEKALLQFLKKVRQ
jgi:transcriptional regulator with XRE-family HTH domain